MILQFQITRRGPSACRVWAFPRSCICQEQGYNIKAGDSCCTLSTKKNVQFLMFSIYLLWAMSQSRFCSIWIIWHCIDLFWLCSVLGNDTRDTYPKFWGISKFYTRQCGHWHKNGTLLLLAFITTHANSLCPQHGSLVGKYQDMALTRGLDNHLR